VSGEVIRGGCECGFWCAKNCAYVKASGVCDLGAGARAFHKRLDEFARQRKEAAR